MLRPPPPCAETSPSQSPPRIRHRVRLITSLISHKPTSHTAPHTSAPPRSIDLHTLRPPLIYRRMQPGYASPPSSQGIESHPKTSTSRATPRRVSMHATNCALSRLLRPSMHTAPSLSMFSPERRHPPPSRARGRTPTPALANGSLASSVPGYPGRTQAVAPAPRTGTCRVRMPRTQGIQAGAAHTRTFAAEVVQPIPGKDEDSNGARAYSALNRFLIWDA
ncbi:hypothetical protein B0H13DRAFT_2669131 [Mycena leptocephala]|nr:hypothetical protein B0H13DRAFT_2669131 [Mycena leptocephala]